MSKGKLIPITVPDDWREAIDEERGSIPLSRWIRDAIKEKLPKRVAAKLSEVKHGGSR